LPVTVINTDRTGRDDLMAATTAPAASTRSDGWPTSWLVEYLGHRGIGPQAEPEDPDETDDTDY
jgi:hypothetical protein